MIAPCAAVCSGDGIGSIGRAGALNVFGYIALMDELADLSDDELIAAYRRTDGAPGKAEPDLLADEIERRGVDL